MSVFKYSYKHSATITIFTLWRRRRVGHVDIFVGDIVGGIFDAPPGQFTTNVNEHVDYIDIVLGCKMVCCVRQDLKMRPGKIAARCVHAAWGVPWQMFQRTRPQSHRRSQPPFLGRLAYNRSNRTYLRQYTEQSLRKRTVAIP